MMQKERKQGKMTVEFYMLVGLPRSGKSHLADQMIKDKIVDVVVSSDKIREKLYGNECIQGDARKVFRVMKEDVLAAMKEGKSVVVDATNINSKRRAAFLAELRAKFDGKFNATCCVVAADPAICIERDCLSERKVGREVIEKMWAQFEVPYYHEGWDHLTYNCTTEPIKKLQLVCGMIGFDQKNHHHVLDLYEHCFRTSMNKKMDNFLLRTAAFYHDVGKMYSQAFDKYGEVHYYNHEKMGSYIFLCSDVFKQLYDLGEAMYIALLICWHMQPYFCPNKDAFYEWCDKKGLAEKEADDLWALHEADILSQ